MPEAANKYNISAKTDQNLTFFGEVPILPAALSVVSTVGFMFSRFRDRNDTDIPDSPKPD